MQYPITRREFINGTLTLVSSMSITGCISIGLNDYEVVEHTITSGKIKDDKETVIVQLSDLHLKSITDLHLRIIREINQLQPHLIFITGDSINEAHQVPLLYEFISQLNASHGIYAVLGNWDYWSLAGVKRLRSEYERAKCTLLRNEKGSVNINGTNYLIIGIDDFIVGKPNMSWYKDDPEDQYFKFLLSHSPGYRNHLPYKEFDLMLSGHTHGGQIKLFGHVPHLPKGSEGYVAGWYNSNKPPMYVNRGIGATFAPVRIGVTPEITVFKIRTVH